MNRKKKNLAIMGISILNFILTIVVMFNLKAMIPINVFGKEIEKMRPREYLLILPIIVIIISIFQVLYRMKTMDKPVTVGKLIEDGAFAFVDGSLMCLNWLLVYIGTEYTNSMLINIKVPVIFIVMAGIGLILAGIYSTYPINKFGSVIGLRTKETLKDNEVWRISNRFNGFTGFVSAIIIVLLSAYFIVNGFNWVYLLAGLVACVLLMFFIPIEYSKMIARKKAERVIE